MAGANSIFFGDKLLTTGNPDHDSDLALLREAGLRPLVPEQAGASDAAEEGGRPKSLGFSAPVAIEFDLQLPSAIKDSC